MELNIHYHRSFQHHCDGWVLDRMDLHNCFTVLKDGCSWREAYYVELIPESRGAEMGLIFETHSGFEAPWGTHFMHIL